MLMSRSWSRFHERRHTSLPSPHWWSFVVLALGQKTPLCPDSGSRHGTAPAAVPMAQRPFPIAKVRTTLTPVVPDASSTKPRSDPDRPALRITWATNQPYYHGETSRGFVSLQFSGHTSALNSPPIPSSRGLSRPLQTPFRDQLCRST